MRILVVFTVALAIAVSFVRAASSSSQVPAAALTIATLSSRPDMVSGGDALIEVRTAGEDVPSDLAITLNGQDVRASFHVDFARKSLIGLVEGLRVGSNTIVAHAGGQMAELELRNFPITGPIVSGEHLKPFACNTIESGLGEPIDTDCSAATKVQYFYKSTAPAVGRSSFKPLTEGLRPPDIAQTTTIDGHRVPYIVRIESGTIDRAIYRIAVLDGPSREALATSMTSLTGTPGTGWNHRLVFSFGAGCGTHYTQGVNRPADVLVDAVLSRGFAHATSTANVMQQYCNDQLSGEALMMIKEHFVERYGIPNWTMGMGGSGGAIQQLLIAQNFPGLLDGLLPSLAFPDAVTIAAGASDCRLLMNYFKRDPHTWTQAKRSAVEGYSAGTCAAWDKAFVDVLVAGDPMTGLARRPLDNVGVQYGLKALTSGAITKAQFLDLNANVGGFDSDGRLRARRTSADVDAVQFAYEAGRVNSGAGGLPSIPILEYRSYNDPQGDIHDRARDFSVRERLRNANGNADNQVMWLYPNGVAGLGQKVTTLAIDTMTRWLDALAKDGSASPVAQKVKRAKPAVAVDACWDVIGTKIDEAAAFDRPSICNALYPSHLNPRLVAGAPIVDDVLKCQLKPIDPRDYKVGFTIDEMLRLRLIFPNGVCDYSKPGVNQEPLAGTFLTLPLRLPRPSALNR